MVDVEVGSTASSEISDSLRELILGKPSARQRKKKTNHTLEESSFEVIQKKDSSFEIVDHPISEGDNKRHTAQNADNFVIVPRQRKSMKSVDDKHHTTIETQTVAIQTIETGADLDLDCCCEECQCVCDDCECDSRNDFNRKDYCECCSKRRLSEDTNFSNIENYTETSSQTIDVNPRNNYCSCKCKRGRRKKWNEDSSCSDSDDSYTTDFFDLPYQNNEEYLKLLRELEKKLLARNKDRVRRTMMEFERRSRQNQNLERPVCDYSDDNASLLRKLSTKAHRHRHHRHPKNNHSICCNCGRNKKVNSDILQNEKKWDEMNFVRNKGDTKGPPSPHHIERSLHKSHWQLDPRSGEWIKVSCFQQTDFSRPPRGDHGKENPTKLTMPPPGQSGFTCKKDCSCRQKNRHQ